MRLDVIAQAAVMFAVTNVDDILLLALYFSRSVDEPGAARRIVIGQYLGFLGILVASVAAALGASFLPETLIPYLGLLPLALGLRAAWQVWQNRGPRSTRSADTAVEMRESGRGGQAPSVQAIAAVTFANGGDNIGLYVPVFTTAGRDGTAVYCVVFMVLVAVWCLLGRLLAGHPVVARVLTAWGHVLLPIVLIAIGFIILVGEGAFGL